MRPAEIRDIRALPAPARSVLAWTTRPSTGQSQQAARVSAALYFQNRNTPAYDDSAMEFPGRIPFEPRLQWIARTVREPGVFDFPRPAA